MDSLKPQSVFPIVRGLPDHTDSGTYYVRAVIRNTIDNTIIATVNLINLSSRYFSYNWEVPVDVSGQGFYISIVTSVYTDSNYTTKSENYGDEFQTYLVAERANQAQIGGIGGGADISYKKVRQIVTEAINEAINGIPKAESMPKIDLSKINERISQEIINLRLDISKIKIPAQEKPADYSEKFARLEKLLIDLSRLKEKKPEHDKKLFSELSNLSYEIRQESEKQLSEFKKLKFIITKGKKSDIIITGKEDKEPEILEDQIVPSYRGNKNIVMPYRRKNA